MQKKRVNKKRSVKNFLKGLLRTLTGFEKSWSRGFFLFKYLIIKTHFFGDLSQSVAFYLKLQIAKPIKTFLQDEY